MKRLGALLFAAALIVGAVVANQAIHGTDAAEGDDIPGADGPIHILCATEFTTACRRLAAQPELADVATFSVIPPGETVATLLADPVPTFDLWITSEPWPEIAKVRAAGRHTDAPQLGGASEPLATSPLSMVVRGDDLFRHMWDYCVSGVNPQSTQSVNGVCLAITGGKTVDDLDRELARYHEEMGMDPPPTIPDAEDIGYLTVKLGVAPTTQTAGLLGIAALTTGWFGPDVDQTDIDVADEFRSGFTDLADASTRSLNPVRDLLTRPAFTVALDLNATRQLADAGDGSRFVATPFVSAEPPQPPDYQSVPSVNAEAVIVPAATGAGRAAFRSVDHQRIADAIVFTGWARGAAPEPAIPIDPAVLDGLVAQWTD